MKTVSLAISLAVAVVVIGAITVPIINQYNTEGEDCLDIIVLAGQSNMAYVVEYMDLEVVNEDIGQPDTDCYFYGYESRPVWYGADLTDCSMHSMTSDGAWIIGGEEVAVAKTVSNHTNDDVYVINVAWPGQAIEQFEPENEAGIYIQDVLTNALSLIPSGYDKIKCGWAWCQGESDQDTAVDDYVTSFLKVQSIFTDYGFKTCYLVQTHPYYSGNATEAQAEIIETVPNVILASTSPSTFTVDNGLLLASTPVHYSQAGRDIVGEDIGNAMCNNLASHLRTNEASGLIAVIPTIMILSLVVATVGHIVFRKE